MGHSSDSPLRPSRPFAPFAGNFSGPHLPPPFVYFVSFVVKKFRPLSFPRFPPLVPNSVYSVCSVGHSSESPLPRSRPFAQFAGNFSGPAIRSRPTRPTRSALPREITRDQIERQHQHTFVADEIAHRLERVHPKFLGRKEALGTQRADVGPILFGKPRDL